LVGGGLLRRGDQGYRRIDWGGEERAYALTPNPNALNSTAAATTNQPTDTHQGASVLQEQQRQIALAVDSARQLRLGGDVGADRGWGHALGCVVTGDLVGWRSALGNALAQRSAEMGLRPVGVVAYVEVGWEGWGVEGLGGGVVLGYGCLGEVLLCAFRPVNSCPLIP